MKTRRFVDSVRVIACAGDGGNGCVSFRRETYVPRGGPDGGDGGRGGHVTLRADAAEDSLVRLFFAPCLQAGRGGHGKGKQQHGAHGRDLVVPVPCGTEIRDADTGRRVGDLVQSGAEQCVAVGGRGGHGNAHCPDARHRASRRATPGEAGERKVLRLELKLAADVGLVGFPNAGKSSLLAALSHAHPRIAPYPFTTRHPIIGTLVFEDYSSIRIADIPGLLEGAHQGVGLGDAFLRHVERAGCLLFVLDMAASGGRDPVDDYRVLRHELRLYRRDLLDRPALIVANKMDLAPAAAHLQAFQRATAQRALPVSALTGQGVERLKGRLAVLVRRR